MHHEEFHELLALHALDILAPPEAASIETYLATSPSLASELSQLRSIAHTLAYTAPLFPLASSLKERLFQQISSHEVRESQEESPAVSKIPSEHTPKYKHPISLISSWQQQAAQAQWQLFLVEGIALSRLALDRHTRRVAYFIRAEAGVKFPNHCHADREEIIMLEGDLTIDGQCYYPGDYIYSPPNSIHQPVTKDGYLAIIRTSLDDQILA